MFCKASAFGVISQTLHTIIVVLAMKISIDPKNHYTPLNNLIQR